MLYSRRKRLKELSEAETRGESFWSEHFDENARMRLVYALNSACGNDPQIIEAYAIRARRLILEELGLPFLRRRDANPYPDLRECIIDGDDEFLPNVIEAIYRTLADFVPDYTRPGSPSRFADTVNTVLREHRISFEFVGAEIVPLASQELHAEIVAPALRLLSGRTGWAKIEAAYQDALGEIANGKSTDAITDVGTALQETFIALECKGNALGPLVKSARDKGLLGPHDMLMTDVIERLVHWVSADRSERGDSHKVAEITTQDAWLAVHVVGALILRLASR